MVFLRVNKQIYKYLSYDYDPRKFTWVDRQSICVQDNLIAHISLRYARWIPT